MNEKIRNNLYKVYSTYLKEIYGEKVYKLTVNLPSTCPNRDGKIGTGGCHFCSEKGAGFETLPSIVEVKDQLQINMEKVGKRFKANRFIAYFQNYTNTYMPYDVFKQYMEAACIENIVELDIATRPDCIDKGYLDILATISEEKHVNIVIELGLQTTNEESLMKINRGHDVKAFIDAVELIHSYGFSVCTHLIMNLPWDEPSEVINMATLINQLNIKMVKCHSLYIAKGTVFERDYLDGVLKLNTLDDYYERILMFIGHLHPNCAIQRLVGRAPKEDAIFCNWNTSWWKIRDEIEEKMLKAGLYQGKMIEEKNE